MSLAEQLAAASRKPGLRCSVCKFLDALPADEAAEVIDAMADNRVTSTALDDWATEAHPDIAPARQTWGRHRRGQCSG